MNIRPEGLPPASLVSLWRHKTDTDASNFLCSGVFVGNGLVLTAKHVFATGGAVWLRPHAAATQSYAPQGESILHPELDAALIRIEIMPTGCQHAEINRDATFDVVKQDLTLNGYFKGGAETAQKLTLTKFDPGARHYLSGTKHPVGHSGSGVEYAGCLWGLAVAHYIDPNTHRGCVISIGQLWPGWLEKYLPVNTAQASNTATRQAPNEARATLLARLKVIIDRAFSSSAWQTQKVIEFRAGQPAELAAALARDDAELGERSVKALFDLSRRITQALRQRDLDVQTTRPTVLREALFEAMGCAAKLCLDLDALPDATNATLMWDIAANTAEGATVVARPQPEKSWLTDVRSGLPQLADPHAIHVPIELGEGEDAQRELTRLAYANLSPSNEVPREVNSKIERQVRGLLHNEADDGKARFLVLRAQDRNKFNPELCAWARRMGLGLIALQGNDGRLFVFDEELLLAKLQAFVRLFDENPEWKS